MQDIKYTDWCIDNNKQYIIYFNETSEIIPQKHVYNFRNTPLISIMKRQLVDDKYTMKECNYEKSIVMRILALFEKIDMGFMIDNIESIVEFDDLWLNGIILEKHGHLLYKYINQYKKKYNTNMYEITERGSQIVKYIQDSDYINLKSNFEKYNIEINNKLVVKDYKKMYPYVFGTASKKYQDFIQLKHLCFPVKDQDHVRISLRKIFYNIFGLGLSKETTKIYSKNIIACYHSKSSVGDILINYKSIYPTLLETCKSFIKKKDLYKDIKNFADAYSITPRFDLQRYICWYMTHNKIKSLDENIFLTLLKKYKHLKENDTFDESTKGLMFYPKLYQSPCEQYNGLYGTM